MMLKRTEVLPLIKFNYPWRKAMNESIWVGNVIEAEKGPNLSSSECLLLTTTFCDGRIDLQPLCVVSTTVSGY
jgi:hypothetical protein